MSTPRRKPSAAELALDPVLTAIAKLVPPGTEPWFGTTAELRARLDELVPAGAKGSPVFWPSSPNGLSRRLDTLAHGLAAHGLVVTRRRAADGRALIISRATQPEVLSPAFPAAADQPS